MKKKGSLIFIVFLMAFVSFLCLSFSIAYSYILFATTSTEKQTITTGTFAPEVTYEAISNFELYNRADDDGLLTEDGVNINITKTTDYSLFFNVNLLYSITDLNGQLTTNDLIPPEYIKVGVFDAEDNLIMGPVSMANLPVNVADSTNIFNTEYELVFGQLPPETEQVSYVLKVWIDAFIPEMYKGYTVNLKLKVHEEPLKAIQRYNISGHVKYEGENISGASIYLHNGNVSAYSNLMGEYTLREVPTGTYNLIVKYQTTSGEETINHEYETMVHIQSGNLVNLAQTGTHTGVSGTYLQNDAHTYYTTVDKILKTNNFLINTGISAASSNYTIPSTYVLTGTKALDAVNILGLDLNIQNETLTLVKN